MKIALAASFYCCLMLSAIYLDLFDSSVLGFILWLFCQFIVGPVLCLIAIVVLIRTAMNRPLRVVDLWPTVISIMVVGCWIISYGHAHVRLQSYVFRFVSEEDEHLAMAFIQEHPPDIELEVSGFRYPFLPVNNGIATVHHHAGIVFIRVLAGPGNLDYLAYISPGSTLPSQSDGLADPSYTARLITGHWYYFHVTNV